MSQRINSKDEKHDMVVSDKQRFCLILYEAQERYNTLQDEKCQAELDKQTISCTLWGDSQRRLCHLWP